MSDSRETELHSVAADTGAHGSERPPAGLRDGDVVEVEYDHEGVHVAVKRDGKEIARAYAFRTTAGWEEATRQAESEAAAKAALYDDRPASYTYTIRTAAGSGDGR